MKQGIIFTKDKTEIDVFFLKDQVPPEIDWQLGHQIGDGTKENPILVDDETGEALMEDMKDCCAGNIFDNPNKLIEEGKGDWISGWGQGVKFVNENSTEEGNHKSCCPVGHKGETGWTGYNTLYDAILDTIRTFKDSELNIASETAQEILAMSIERKVNNYYDKK